MRRIMTVAVVLAWLLLAGEARAHDVVPGVGGFSGGLLHPLLVPAHVLALIALGLALGQKKQRPNADLTLFVVGLGVGIGLIVTAFSITTDLAVLAAAAAAGIATAIGRPLPLALSGSLAIIAGVAIAFDSVPQEISMQTTFLALVGTAVSASVVVGLVAEAARRLTRDWQRVGMRIVGSWIAAAVVMVLALRLAS